MTVENVATSKTMVTRVSPDDEMSVRKYLLEAKVEAGKSHVSERPKAC